MMPTLPHALRKRLILIAAAACLTLLAACGSGQQGTPALPASPAPIRDYWPTDGWRSDSPTNRGLDAAALAGLRPRSSRSCPSSTAC